MAAISNFLSSLDRLAVMPLQCVGTSWLLIFSIFDMISGFFFSGLLFNLIVSANFSAILSNALNLYILTAFCFRVFKNVGFVQLYNSWVKSSIQERGNIAKLNETISFCAPDDSQSFFKGANESLLNDSKQRLNVTMSDSCSIDQSFYCSNDKPKAIPASMLVSSQSPFFKPMFTEGHYSSVSFDTSEHSTLDDDYFTSKKLDWIFNSASFATSDQSTGSYKVGFVMKDKVVDDVQKDQSTSDDFFNGYSKAESLNADAGTESIFADSQRKDSSKRSISLKRDALLKKVLEWREEKGNVSLDDSLKNKNVQSLMDDLFSSATIHRIAFNNAVSLDLAYFSANLRCFLSNEIIKPIVKYIDETNSLLMQSSAKFSIGASTIEVLKMAMEQKPDLCTTKLPFLIPFLSIHPNQVLLVKKFREFVHRPFVYHETIGNTSFEKLKDFANTKADEFLSEAEFMFYVFCTYLDHRLSSDSFAKNPQQPFSSIYVLKEMEKPSPFQLMPKSFYIYMRNKKVTSFDFVINGGFDFYVTQTSDTESMFYAFMLLFVYCKQFNNGYLGEMRIDSKGLDLLRLFRSHH